ncbi:hypothetical protein ACHAXN_011891 [Cyclotella atomus]
MRSVTDLASLARFILSPDCQSIVILTGAGVSVASGIPDFRSPGGMYDTLRPELITATEQQRKLMTMDPTYVVEKNMFLQNSFPYLEVRRPFILGVRDRIWKPTIAHHFASLLHSKADKLTRVYTQNIDGLTNAVGLPDGKIVSVHGTIGKAGCESCGEDMDFDAFCSEVEVNCPSCGKATVKPKTVLFGSSLPAEFFDKASQDLPTTDLLIVAGTSLVVSPANSLAYNVPTNTVRVIVNNEPAGEELGIDYSPDAKRDFFARGDCDEVFLDLIGELGWIADLKELEDNLPRVSLELINAKYK